MIVTVTLNPSLDKTLSVPRLQPGSVHRARIVREDWGGKGINVSRALRALGLSSKLIGFLGGGAGQALRQGLEREGFDVHFVEVAGETRRNITMYDESSGVYTKINEAGPQVGPEHLAALEAYIDENCRPGDLWALCGRLPPGVPLDYYARLIGRIQAGEGRCFLDSSGIALCEGVAARPFAVKPNSEEAAEVLGHSVRGDDEHRSAAQHLQSGGIALVALTRGARGLVLAVDGEVLQAGPPSIKARSPVGAGDAALAGLLWAVYDGCDPAETARRSLACGTAAAIQEGTGVGDRALVESLLEQVQVTWF